MSLLLALAGCVLLPRAVPDTRAQALAAADQRFRDRGADPDAVDAASAAWTLLLDGSAHDAELQARLAQAAWIRGRAEVKDPAAARVQFELAEEAGWACALTSPAFAARVRREGGRSSVDAIALLGAKEAPCLAWTSAGLVELLQLRGAGADLDLATLDALRAALHGIPEAVAAPWEPNGLPGFLPWLDARRALLAEDPFVRQAARGDFDRAVDEAPDFLPWQRDRAVAFPATAAGGPPPESETRWPLESRDARATWPTGAP